VHDAPGRGENLNFGQLLIAGITSGMVYGLIALGYHIVFRATQLIDFAQGEKAVFGGLAALALLSAIGNHPWLALIIVAAGGYIVGWLYERVILRPVYSRPAIVPIIATVGVAQFVYFGDGLIWGSSARPFPYSFSGDPQAALALGSLRVQVERIWVWILVLVVVAACSVFFERSRRGQAMIAAADNQLGAQLSGIDVGAMRSNAMSMATALAMFGGALIAPFTLAGGSIGLSIAVKSFAGAMIGGIASPYGVVVGALIVGITESTAAGFLSHGYRDPVAFSLLLLVLLIRPQGIFARRIGRAA
jgi:branched-chain amino acid transport system permease protein